MNLQTEDYARQISANTRVVTEGQVSLRGAARMASEV